MYQRIITSALALLAVTCAGAIQAAPSAASAVQASADLVSATHAASQVFASVGDTIITYDEYNAAFSAAARGKFFHGKPPEGDIALLQREVADNMVTRILLLREARRRGLQPDHEEVRKTLAGYEQRYAGSEQWKQNREQALPALTVRLEETSLLEQLEKAVRATAVPDSKQVAAYYAANPEKFTEPEQLHLKVILLRVDPSSPQEAWEKAGQDAQDIVSQLSGGADFAELARQRSGDAGSAQQGGDLGYRHSGMLPENVKQVLDGLKPGDLSPPVRVLQGYTVFRLVDRKQPRLVDFDASRERAHQLLQREQSDAAWKALADRLKKKTPAKIDSSKFLPLPSTSSSSPGTGASASH